MAKNLNFCSILILEQHVNGPVLLAAMNIFSYANSSCPKVRKCDNDECLFRYSGLQSVSKSLPPRLSWFSLKFSKSFWIAIFSLFQMCNKRSYLLRLKAALARSASAGSQDLERASSTCATISIVGIFLGAGENFMPNSNTFVSSSDKRRSDKFGSGTTCIGGPYHRLESEGHWENRKDKNKKS